MFRLNRAALNYSVVKLSRQTQRKYFFPVSEAAETEGVMCRHLGGDTALKQGMMCCTQGRSSSTLAQTRQSFISPPVVLWADFVSGICFLLYLAGSQRGGNDKSVT